MPLAPTRRSVGALRLALCLSLPLAGLAAGQAAGPAAPADAPASAEAGSSVAPVLRFVGVPGGGAAAAHTPLGVRGVEGVTGLAAVLENAAGETVATGLGGSVAVLMTGPPEARRPWTPAGASPGAYTLRASASTAAGETVREAVGFRLAPAASAAPAAAPFAAAFGASEPQRRRLGDSEPIELVVTGAPAPGEDVLVVAWDPQRLEMREDFAQVLDGPPWWIEGERLARLAPGVVELQLMQRRDGEVLGVARHPLEVAAEEDPAGETPAAEAAEEPAPRPLELSESLGAPGVADSRVTPRVASDASGEGDGGAASAAGSAAAPAAAPAAAAAPPAVARADRPQPATRPAPASAIRQPGGAATPPAAPAPGAPVASAGPGTPAPALDPGFAVATPEPAPAPVAGETPQPASDPAPEPAPAAKPAPKAPGVVNAAKPISPRPTPPSAAPKPTPPSAAPKPTPSRPSPRPGAGRSDAGFTSFPVARDARLVYVSSSAGSDRNDGLSPQRPLARIESGKSLLRDGFPDRLLIRAGDVFDGPFGFWDKSGRSESQPMIVSTYGEGDRPVFLCGLETGLLSHTGNGVSHVVFQGFELLAQTRVPGSRDFRREDTSEFRYGVIWRQTGGNILFEDLKISHFSVNMELKAFDDVDRGKQAELQRQRDGEHGLADLTINRCILTDAYSAGGHAQGLFTSGLTGLVVRDSVFDHNGWNAQVPGAVRTMFNHNLYNYFTLNAPVTLEGNIITRAASHGAQVRPGGNVRNNFFARNALALMVCDAPTEVAANVILESDDIDSSANGGRGLGIEAKSVERLLVRDNIIARKVGSGTHLAAIRVEEKEDVWHDWMGNFDLRAVVKDNIIYQWKMSDRWEAIQVVDEINAPEVSGNVVVDSGESRPFDGPAFTDEGAGVESYLGGHDERGGLDRFLELARERPRGTWDSRWTATGINSHIRQGFSFVPFD
ncbi:hypothetical protein [Phycisphaera mikurensis]|uniref:Right handed beta helix domain-containing protein n=1 Tax=Phycisphaera mikurensis (strain NBRC 102666 / KCTC 22515 / FYK2301M01) TaxID=1142394 RepID=I0IHX7_PHYMF|nr:hypothetical protein [Phycisphaera mikurensis]MBB6441105.1 hypothetical protein [Phycisphaera mikurensis]BAM04865.1 hypothetical protein PSMK_27060 [Phycisphaera mikurensis NBRC 102666]